jgi:mono/diheme cytochrome c family protein
LTHTLTRSLDILIGLADVKDQSNLLGCVETVAMGRSLRLGHRRWVDVLVGTASLSILAVCSAAVLADDTPRAQEKLDPALEEFFEANVRPVLIAHCLECHGAEKSKGGLRLDARGAMLKGGETGPVVIPGKPEDSPLIEAIRYEGDVQMPPKGKLKDGDIAVLTEWVKRGAPWPDVRRGMAPQRSSLRSTSVAALTTAHAEGAFGQDRSLWSLQPVRNPAPPRVSDVAWPRSVIDCFILARLEENGLAPAPRADRATLIRRATYDLTGLPPTAVEIEAFLRDDGPDAFACAVDRLLASPRYGERWGRFWLDLARYGEDQAHSFKPRLYPYAYRYRDWVIHSLNQDVPYDCFVREQIAGDLLDGPGGTDRLAALGFFACGPVYYGDAKKHDQYADRIDTLTRTFLGLTVACARCHDHKYDPIPTTDYYALEGVFASTEYAEIPDAPPEQIEAFQKGQAAIQRKETEITAFLKEEAARLKMKPAANQLKQIESSLSTEARKKLATLRAELRLLQKIAPPKYPIIHVLRDASRATDMPVLVRGNAETPGAKVPRRFLTVLAGNQSRFQRGSGRLELACAITSTTNPLVARVIVNRVWQHHFGMGLVPTASNFGALGERPSHPELLDWLANHLMKSNWSLKAIHRAIMLSAVYSQSNRFDSQGFAQDPGNRLLWRMNRQRLDVEAWRDAMLAVADRLDPRIGGPSVSLDASSNERRTLYAAISRHDLSWMLRLFDFPDPNITSGGRVETTVPLQQLFVLNGDFIVHAAQTFADRLLGAGEHKLSDSDRIRQAYLLLFGRPVTARELALGLSYLEESGSTAAGPQTAETHRQRWNRYAQALLATNEFLFID